MTVFWDAAHRVVWQKFTDVSEVFTASIIRAILHIALMMEAASTSEASANFYQTTRCAACQKPVIFILATVRT
jgi:hypothetical protein